MIDTETKPEIEKKSIDEKLNLLTPTEKAFVMGYIDGAMAKYRVFTKEEIEVMQDKAITL